jgi:hypothetical protein
MQQYGYRGEVSPLDDTGVAWKDFAACYKTVGSEERKRWHKVGAKHVSSNTQSLCAEA